jgi:isopentenyl-diphosphate delta-isomerase
MDERIDIINKDGSPTGQSDLKSIIHKRGYYHNTAHVWFYTKEGEILLAQRAATKTICPLLWDVSVAGHVDAGEAIIHAAIRETQEEIGLSVCEEIFEKIGVFPCFQTYDNGIIDNEFHHTYIAELLVELNHLKPQKSEVEALKLVTLEEFENLLNQGDINNHFIKSNGKYYLIVLNVIRQKLAQH